MSACWHVGIAALIIPSYALVHWCTDIVRIKTPTCRQAIQYTNFYTLQLIKYDNYWNTYKYAMNYSLYTWFKTRVSKGNTLYCNEMDNLVTHHFYTNAKFLLSGLHKQTFTSYYHMQMSILLYISFLEFCVMVRALQN